MNEQDQFQRLTRLFDQVVAEDPADREAEIVRLCDGDDDLAAQLRAMVAADVEQPAAVDPLHVAVADELDTFEAIGRIGQSIGRYTILQRVGGGGMGTVYAVYDNELDRRVALKLLHGHRSERARTRALREAQAMARLSHPNVVPVFEVGEHERQLFVVMEYVRGATLDAASVDRSWAEILGLYVQAGRGLAEAHRQGLVHRDFKPQNAVVGDDGRVRVLDFGLAAKQESAASTKASRSWLPEVPGGALDTPLTKTGAVMGTPAYMPPEQFAAGTADHRGDQFSFCVSLWEALYGARPFLGATKSELFAAVASGTLPETPRASVPAAARALLARGLKPDPKDRWPAMSELLDALERVRAAPGVRRRNRRIAIVGAVTAAGLGAVLVGGPWLQRREHDAGRERCAAEAAEEAAAVWSAGVRERVHSALASIDLAYAERTASRAAQLLDDYAAAWVEARTQVCVSATVEETWTPDDMARAQWCLDGRARGFAELVDQLAQADASAVNRAVTAAGQLARVDECRDVSLLRRSAAHEPPRDRAAALQARAALARAQALLATGRHGAALRDARALVENETAVREEALFTVGSALASDGKYDEAERVLEDAYFAALQAGDYAAAEHAASRLVFVVGYRGARRVDGVRWGRLAQAALAELGADPGDVREATRQQSLGAVHDAAGDVVSARTAFSTAHAIREATLGVDHPDTIETLDSLGILEMRAGNPDAAITLHERALAARERIYGPQHPVVARSLNNLGAVFGGPVGRFDEAEAALERALEIREGALGRNHPDLAATHLNLGAVRLRSGRSPEAKANFERSIEIARAAHGEDHPDIARGLSMLATLYQLDGELERAKSMHERALAVIENTYGSSHPLLAPSVMNLAQVHHALGEHDRETELGERALALLIEVHGPEHLEVAQAHFNLANAYAEARNHAGAAEHYARAVDLAGTRLGPGLHHLEARFGLAKALADQDLDLERAISVARDAADGYRAAGEPGATALTEVEAWLAAHADGG